MTTPVQKHMDLLGMKVKDRVTGFVGVVASVGFDLYGCVQAIVTPMASTDATKIEESRWFDVSRLEVTDQEPVMARPNYDYGGIAEGRKGPAEKPSSTRF